MRRIVTAATSAMMVLLAGASIAQEEEQEATPLSFRPVEAYACSFNEGKGPADLAAVVKDWNDWMDEEGRTDYFAFTMWPSFFGERNFDVAWFGVWPDGNAMGAATDFWINSGQEYAARYSDVLTCGAHTQFASVQMRQPPEREMERGDSFVLTFSDCSMEEGKSFEDYVAAQDEWNAYAEEHGIISGAWAMFPVWGENVEADYDFKAVASAADYTQLGANWAKYAEGHYRKANEIFDGLLDCDSQRVYTATVERLMADDDE